jgi:hypothetical protein
MTIVTTADLAALRLRYANLRQAAALLAEVGEDDQARTLYRRAGDMLAVPYAVLHPCVLCDAPTAVRVTLQVPGTVEAVLCGPCGQPPGAAGMNPRPAAIVIT